MAKTPKLERIAILSVHTSPLHQPGTGDAGGMNVYIAETAKRIARQGIEVEIFTRATSAADLEDRNLVDGVKVRHISAGPFEGLRKDDLPAQLCAVTAGVLRAEAHKPEGFYNLIHSHYWLSGQVGWIAKERWNIPLVHTMHTMARVKNLQLAEGDTPEPAIREIGEEQVVLAADRLVANTDAEARELVNLYNANPDHVRVVNPGVDLEQFKPGSKAAAREFLALPSNSQVLLFVGRIQPLKAPDVLVRAAAEMIAREPQLRHSLIVAICGGPSGSGLEKPESLIELARELGIADVVRFEPPTNRERLAQWYRAADLTIVPSHSESFGLVALESQASGTPVVAANVGGLPTAVHRGEGGVLVDGHDPLNWARAISETLAKPELIASLREGGLKHAVNFGWDATTEKLIAVYEEAIVHNYNQRATA